jgi:hypothetical protein
VRFPQLVRAPERLGPNVPELFADVVLAMMAHDPARRPAARDVADALEPLVAAVPHRVTVSSRLRFVARR